MKGMWLSVLSVFLALGLGVVGCSFQEDGPEVASGTVTILIQSSAGAKGGIAVEEVEIVRAVLDLSGPEGYFQSQTWTKGGASVFLFDGLRAGDNELTVTEYDGSDHVLNTYSAVFRARAGYHHRIKVTLGLGASIIVDSGCDVIDDYELRIPDANFRLSMEEAVGKMFGNITYCDLELVDYLHCMWRPITELTGIELCTSLQGLDIGDAGIDDIAPLASVPSFRYLVAWGCNLTDLSPLLSLPEMRAVFVQGNPLDQADLAIFTPANFPHLEGLGFDGTDEATWTPFLTANQAIGMFILFPELVNVALDRVPLGDSGFQTFYDFVISRNAPTFVGLEVGDTGISDTSLATIGGLHSLTNLGIWGNLLITDLSLLIDSTDLEFLCFDGTGVTDLSPLLDLYDSGAFRGEWAWIQMRRLGLDLTSGTPNRDVVDQLISDGVFVEFEEGNTVD
jgi:hypothetical protein